MQTITRPLGTLVYHSTLGFQMGAQAAGLIETQHYQEEQAKNLLKQADELRKTMATLHKQMKTTQDLSDTTHQTVTSPNKPCRSPRRCATTSLSSTTSSGRFRSYFYWEKHCFDIPSCWVLRSIFNALDGIDAVTEQHSRTSAQIFQVSDDIQPRSWWR